jgi:hypothetical protein
MCVCVCVGGGQSVPRPALISGVAANNSLSARRTLTPLLGGHSPPPHPHTAIMRECGGVLQIHENLEGNFIHTKNYIFIRLSSRIPNPCKHCSALKFHREIFNKRKLFLIPCHRTSRSPVPHSEVSRFKSWSGHQLSNILHSFLEFLQPNSGIVR